MRVPHRSWPLALLVVGCSTADPTVSDFIVLDASVDAGAARDAAPLDAGSVDAARPADAGAVPDAGSEADTGSDADAGPSDAGLPLDACDAAAGLTDRTRFDRLLRCLRDGRASAETQRRARDREWAAIEASGGFPIVAAGEVTFAYVADPAYDVEDDARTAEDFAPERRQAPLRVAGDFNGWQSEPGLLMQAEAQDIFHVTVTLDVASSDRWAYKFVATDDLGADVWFSDPRSRRFDYDPNGRISLVHGGATEGHLELLRDVAAAQLGNSRDVYVYLPPGYDLGAATYPVLYMHDGNNLFSVDQPWSAPASWEVDQVLERELAAGTIAPFIVVGVPNNADRRDEYTHVVDETSSGVAGGDGRAYAAFVVDDLKPRVDGRYRTAPGRRSTGVMGSSLGGLISFYIGLLHPDVFRFVGGMSSTFGWGRFGRSGPDMVQAYRMASGLAGRDQVFYLDSGGGPPTNGCTTAAGSGSDNYCSTARMRDTLVAAGFDVFPDDPDVTPLTPADIEIMHWWTPDAPHNELAWQARSHRAFRLFARP